MSDKLKKFFQKKKVDVKFKRAGPGHRLNEDTTSKNLPKTGEASKTCRVEPTDEAKQAAAAALARFESKKSTTGPMNSSLAAIKFRAQKEMEAEKKNIERYEETFTNSEESSTTAEVPRPLATSGVFFQCPMIGLEVLKQEEWHLKIEEFIKEQMKDDPILQSILLIQNCNHNRSKAFLYALNDDENKYRKSCFLSLAKLVLKVEECIKLLVTYAENIIRNRDEEKYRKIRLSNKTFMEKVLPIKGAIEFLESVGFVKKKLMHQDQEEDFLVFPEGCLDNLASVQTTVDDLQSAERIQLVLDRNVQVLLPSQASKQVSLPPDFFIMSTTEIKTEYQKRTEKLESEMILKTKSMRMKEQNKLKLNYKYCLIRVKFPDCLILQGTFGVNEHLSDVLEFVKESVFDEERPFKLRLSSGCTFGLEHENMTLNELSLIPTSILLFTNDPSENDQEHPYLKDELMSLVQDTT